MTIIELPEGYHWEITKVLRHKDGHDGECRIDWDLIYPIYPIYPPCSIRETRYALSYRENSQREMLNGTHVVTVPGKHWWNRSTKERVPNYITETTTEIIDCIYLPTEFDADVIRETAWTMLYNLALKDPLNDPRNKFVGVYPPKTLD